MSNLAFQLLAAANYIDALGGVSQSYRQALAAHEAAKERTGWPADGRMAQDDSRELSKWLSNTPGARRLVDEAAKPEPNAWRCAKCHHLYEEKVTLCDCMPEKQEWLPAFVSDAAPVPEAAKPAPVAGLHFRKKPVVIEAMQWDGSWDSLEAIKAKFPAMEVCATTLHPPSKKVYSWSVRTLEGSHQVSVGDWIIKGVKGEFYPCKPDIFAMTYDPAAAPVAVASQWQPIESAPKDGSLLLLKEKWEDEPFIGQWVNSAYGGRWAASRTHYDTDGNACVIDRVYSDGVAHWMPLHPAPKEQANG